MHFLNSVWALLGSNAGQIQSIIAIAAFILAIIGYFKVIHQIKMAKAQEEMAIDQRDFNLKILSINTVISAIDHNHRSQKELYELKKFIKEDIGASDEEDEAIKKELIENIDAQIEASEKMRNKMIATCETLNSLKQNGRTVRDGKMLNLAIKSILIDIGESQRNELIRRSWTQSE
ncbi:hypothetical protein [Acinetobacter johnsonii]|uniref:hypothetical protein n=1 Tax=Acinetobacter johnsonii TaxID=40214 RepID=UPI00248F8592|nr:hypothetical protein [Acinetobacter johnsonii]